MASDDPPPPKDKENGENAQGFTIPPIALVIGGLVTGLATAIYSIYVSIQSNLNADCDFHREQMSSNLAGRESPSARFVEEWCGFNPGLADALSMFLYGFGV